MSEFRANYPSKIINLRPKSLKRVLFVARDNRIIYNSEDGHLLPKTILFTCRGFKVVKYKLSQLEQEVAKEEKKSKNLTVVIVKLIIHVSSYDFL